MKSTTLLLLCGLLLPSSALASGGHDDHAAHDEHSDEHDEMKRGPHGGRLLHDGDLRLELQIFEAGVPPEYRAWVWRHGDDVAPDAANLTVKLHRLGGETDTIAFAPQGGFLRGQQRVAEPHSFDVEVTLKVGDAEAHWQFESHEGRVRIAQAMADEAGLETSVAGPGVLQITRALTGRVHVDPNRVSRVRARYPGQIESVGAVLWSRVEPGQTLARVQSNDSLQSYSVTAPIGGWVVNRAAQVGEVTGDEPLFVIADLSELWAELDVFDHDLEAVQVGQSVTLIGLHGEPLAQARIEQMSPLAIHAAQSVRARVVVPNPEGRLRPGQYVRGEVTVERRPVNLLVPKAALQSFRDFTVVYEQVGEEYEVRMLELGAQDANAVEVLGGLKPGARFVSANSYLIKADIEKSGASHDH